MHDIRESTPAAQRSPRQAQWVLVLFGLGICWVLLAAVGELMPGRLYGSALGLTTVTSTYVAVRGPAWYQAYRIGRFVDREIAAARATQSPQYQARHAAHHS